MAVNSLDRVSSRLEEGCAALRSGAWDEARDRFERALEADFENPDVLHALKCARFFEDWIERAEAPEDPFDRGDEWIAAWKAFRAYEKTLANVREDVSFSFKCFAFLMAQRNYERAAERDGSDCTGQACLRIGRCKKARGDFEGALRDLEAAAKTSRENAEALAELADAYALASETRLSKALFREAFFLDPSRIDIELLESPLFKGLEERVAELGFDERETREWIPVYGAIWGVFSVKRELKAIEASRLRQSVYQLESDVREGHGDRSVAVPRLLNRYFWQIDHFIAEKEDRAKIDEVLLKIKLLDPAVHEMYAS